MELVFFGNEKLATGIHSVEPVILQSVIAAGFEIEQHVTGKLKELKPHRSKIAVLAAYGHIIPQSVLDEFPLGIINVHPSLLPLNRGPTPIEQVILDGSTKTGVSIMRLTAGMDEGPIYKQKTIHLTGGESKQELTERLQQLGGELLIELLPAIVSGELKPHSQPHPDRATYSHKLSKEDGIIEWSKPANQIECEIRAYIGWPKSRTIIGSKEVIITKATAATDTNGQSGSVSLRENQLIVNCGKGSLVIEEIKPAGKNEMTGASFARGYLRY